MRIVKIICVVIAVIGALYLWGFIRLNSFEKQKTVILPSGTRVSASITEVKRMPGDVVQVRMELAWPRRKGETVDVPDMSLSRPKATLLPFPIECRDDRRPAQDPTSDRAICMPAFRLTKDARSIDITQPVYVRRPDAAVCAEFPLADHSSRPAVRQLRTASIQLLDWGGGRNYRRGHWFPVEMRDSHGDGDVAAEYLCFRVNQTDPTGPLVRGSWRRRSDDVGESGEAELVDQHGRTQPMVASYVAESDSTEIHYKADRSPMIFIESAIGILCAGRGISPLSGGWAERIGYDHGNGHWLYAFRPKPGVWYTRLRIKYVLPPSPKDVVHIRFKDVPI